MPEELRLTIELVPSPCWFNNLRTRIPHAAWDKLRKKVYAQLQQKLLTDNPWVMLYVGSQYEAMKSFVKGYIHNATGSNIGFAATWLDK